MILIFFFLNHIPEDTLGKPKRSRRKPYLINWVGRVRVCGWVGVEMGSYFLEKKWRMVLKNLQQVLGFLGSMLV